MTSTSGQTRRRAGMGARRRPYQTIAEALAAVEPDGVIHVMRGTYPITQQLALTKPA